MILTNREKADIEKWQHGLKNDIQLQLSVRDDEAGRQISAFCSELTGLAPEITLKNIKEEDSSLSTIKVGRNVSYHAVPLFNEFIPFLKAIINGNFKHELVEAAEDALSNIF